MRVTGSRVEQNNWEGVTVAANPEEVAVGTDPNID